MKRDAHRKSNADAVSTDRSRSADVMAIPKGDEKRLRHGHAATHPDGQNDDRAGERGPRTVWGGTDRAAQVRVLTWAADASRPVPARRPPPARGRQQPGGREDRGSGEV